MPNISNEQKELLDIFSNLLLKWNRSINLIGKSTEEDIWQRHILDSAQLIKYMPDGAKTITDIGSGAGLPGLIIAILTGKEAHLIESDNKKSAFLIEAKRVIGIPNLIIHNERIEKLTPWKSDIITSRAFADMGDILSLSHPFMKKDSLNIMLKGSNVASEIDEVNKNWSMDITTHPSITNPESNIIILTNLERKI